MKNLTIQSSQMVKRERVTFITKTGDIHQQALPGSY